MPSLTVMMNNGTSNNHYILSLVACYKNCAVMAANIMLISKAKIVVVNYSHTLMEYWSESTKGPLSCILHILFKKDDMRLT